MTPHGRGASCTGAEPAGTPIEAARVSSRPMSLLHPPAPGRIAAALGVLALVSAAGWARADAPALSLPLGVTTPGPIRQLFLDATLTDARSVTSAGLQLRLETANSWSVPTLLTRDGKAVAVQTDAQADALVLAVRIPWSSMGGGDGWRGRVATTLGWRFTGFWGGFEDGGIEAWHRLVGSTDFLRNQYPRDHIRIQLADVGGPTAIDIRSGRLAPGDLVIGTQVLLAAGGVSRVKDAGPSDPAWGVATRFDLKLPTGELSRAGGSGGTDASVSLLASAEVTPWLVVHGRTSVAAFSRLASDVALQPRTFHYSFEGSAVLLAGSWALVLEDRWLSALCEGGWTVVDGGNDDAYLASAAAALLRPHNQITVGVRRGIATLSLSEDFTPGSNPRAAVSWFYNSNAPDVVLAFTLALPL